MGLSQATVEAAIRADVAKQRVIPLQTFIERTIEVGGHKVEYHPYSWTEGIINVGTDVVRQCQINLSDYEREVLSRLLVVDFRGNVELRQQVDSAAIEVRKTNDNYGSITLHPASEGVANVLERVPIMGLTRNAAPRPRRAGAIQK